MTLKQLKNRVHQYLDAIWMMSNRKGKARTSMYKWLAVQMNKYIQLMGHDLDYNPDDIIKEELKKYMEQSPDTIHLVNTWELKSFLEFTDMYIMYDNRPKIEDLNLFKRQLRDEVDDDTYKKLEDFIENYLKFYNK